MPAFVEYITAIRFLHASLFALNEGDGNPQTKEIAILKRKKISADIYLPKKSGSRGTILVVHGMSRLANRDPRVMRACHSFCRMGFTVVAPLFVRIRNLQIDLRDAEEIEAVIRSVAGNRTLSSTGRISLFAPSFSAAITLVAASRKGTAEYVKAIWTLGAPGNVGSAIGHMMGRSDADLYGTYILFKNFIELSVGKNAALKRAFQIAAQDNLHKSADEIERHLRGLSNRDRHLFEELSADPAARLAHWRRIRPKIGPLIAGLSTGPVLDGIVAPVLLMHGASDAVIPAGESRLIYDYLKKRGKPARLAITDLITHGDVRLGPRSMCALIRLISAIGFFFRHAEGSAR